MLANTFRPPTAFSGSVGKGMGAAKAPGIPDEVDVMFGLSAADDVEVPDAGSARNAACIGAPWYGSCLFSCANGAFSDAADLLFLRPAPSTPQQIRRPTSRPKS
jgi:hypothetical protein